MKHCSHCNSKFSGRGHLKYKPNKMLKEVLYCQKCWEERGRVEPVSIASILRKDYNEVLLNN